MRIESNGSNNYFIYINNLYIKNVNISTKEEVGFFVKDLIVKLKNIYNITLKGFYEVEVKINKKIGVFIIINKINKYDFYMDEIDLKINIDFNSKFYYKTKEYLVIKDFNVIKYKDGNYYINMDNISSDIITRLVEFGTFSFDI